MGIANGPAKLNQYIHFNDNGPMPTEQSWGPLPSALRYGFNDVIYSCATGIWYINRGRGVWERHSEGKPYQPSKEQRAWALMMKA